MTTEVETVLARVKKLLTHADSAAALGSQEEAAAFAAKATQLLLDHKLSLSDVELLAEQAEDPILDGWFNPMAHTDIKRGAGARRAAWVEEIICAVAAAHFCSVIVLPGSKRVCIVGRKSDGELACYLIVTLITVADRLAVKHERVVRVAAQKNGDAPPESPKRAFLLGFAAAIAQRLRAQRQQAMQQGGQHALTVFRSAELAVAEHIKANIKTSKVGSPSSVVHDADSFSAGHAAGKQVSLHGGLAEGTKQGTLGKGQALLGGGK